MSTWLPGLALGQHNLAKLESELAWTLAQAAGRWLTRVERDHVYVTIGAGDTYAALAELIRTVVQNGVRLEVDDIRRLEVWLDAHLGHEDEHSLRLMVKQVLQRPPAAQPGSPSARGPYLTPARTYRRRQI